MGAIAVITTFFILCMTVCTLPVKSAEVMSMSTIVTPQHIDTEQCCKLFKMPAEKLFYLTISSVNANKFTVEEIQSTSGYILFNAVGKQYLASIIKLDNNRSVLKITPADNIYYFQPGIVLNLFKYIDVNSLEPLLQIPESI